LQVRDLTSVSSADAGTKIRVACPSPHGRGHGDSVWQTIAGTEHQ
jgi:hypothetical protein